jgi:hypothetical protein
MVIMARRNLDAIRDCVKIAIEQGAKRGYEFKTMSYAIIAELKRIGYSSSEIKDVLLEWNERCEKPLAPNEQKRQLLDFADWAEKHNCYIGCSGRLEEFCIGQEACVFHKKKSYSNRKATEQLPFDFDEVKKFLEIRYRAEGYLMILILKAIRRIQIERATGEIVIVGLRPIQSVIRDTDGHIVDLMTISRRMQDLVSEGMLEIAIKGKKGILSRQANGYRFLAWKPPYTTQNNLLGNKS